MALIDTDRAGVSQLLSSFRNEMVEGRGQFLARDFHDLTFFQRRYRPDGTGLGSLLLDMQPGAMLCFPLFDREDSSAKVSELSKFLLDCL
jgi:hypothetical protein